jgi:hypothetical protein
MIEKPTSPERRMLYEPPRAVDLSSFSVNGQSGITAGTCVNGQTAEPNCNVGLSANARCKVGGIASSCLSGSTLNATYLAPGGSA